MSYLNKIIYKGPIKNYLTVIVLAVVITVVGVSGCYNMKVATNISSLNPGDDSLVPFNPTAIFS